MDERQLRSLAEDYGNAVLQGDLHAAASYLLSSPQVSTYRSYIKRELLGRFDSYEVLDLSVYGDNGVVQTKFASPAQEEIVTLHFKTLGDVTKIYAMGPRPPGIPRPPRVPPKPPKPRRKR